MMALLELKNVSKTYTGEVSVEVLQQIDLKVPEGEFISIMCHLAVARPPC